MLSDVFARYFGLQNKPSSGGLKKRSEYKHKVIKMAVRTAILYLYSLFFFSPPKKVCFANRNIGQIRHLAYVFYFISLSILKIPQSSRRKDQFTVVYFSLHY